MQKIHAAAALGALVVALSAGAPASAASQILELPISPVDFDPTTGNPSLTIPAGTYHAYSFNVLRVAGDGGFASDVNWSLRRGAQTIVNSGSSVDVPNHGQVIPELSWAGFFDPPLVSTGAANEFTFVPLDPDGDTAWASRLVLSPDPPANPPLTPTALPTMPVADDNMFVSAPIGPANRVAWFSFDYSNQLPVGVELDTRGSDLPLTDLAANDTDMALYDADGNLVREAHWRAVSGGAPFSTSWMFIHPSGGLAHGTYYLAITGGAAVFGPTNFEVFPALDVNGQPVSGTVVVHGLSEIPEPTSLGALATAAFLLRRRRTRRHGEA